MKYLAHFLSSLLLICLVASSALSEELKESFYSQISSAVVRLEHFETVKQEGSTNVIVKNIPDGTAFFVVGKQQGFIVSARHVVEKPYDLHARVQVKNDKTGAQKVLLLKLPRDKWIYHDNKGDPETNYVDVAVMRLFALPNHIPSYFTYDPKEFSDEKKNQLPFADPEPPRPIVVFGFPGDIGFDLMEQNPLSRLGIVSMKSGKKFIKFSDGKFVEERACLIDARIFIGNSGSPVMNQMTFADPQPKLLGLVIATNTGLDFAIIEPTSRIRETIDQAIDKEPQGTWEEIKE